MPDYTPQKDDVISVHFDSRKMFPGEVGMYAAVQSPMYHEELFSAVDTIHHNYTRLWLEFCVEEFRYRVDPHFYVSSSSLSATYAWFNVKMQSDSDYERLQPIIASIFIHGIETVNRTRNAMVEHMHWKIMRYENTIRINVFSRDETMFNFAIETNRAKLVITEMSERVVDLAQLPNSMLEDIRYKDDVYLMFDTVYEKNEDFMTIWSSFLEDLSCILNLSNKIPEDDSEESRSLLYRWKLQEHL